MYDIQQSKSVLNFIKRPQKVFAEQLGPAQKVSRAVGWTLRERLGWSVAVLGKTPRVLYFCCLTINTSRIFLNSVGVGLEQHVSVVVSIGTRGGLRDSHRRRAAHR
jgi:hypothetical protein